MDFFVLFCFALLLSESKCSSFMGIIGCDFRKSRCECDFGMRSGDRRLLKALRNQKQIDAKKVKIYLNKTFWNKYISFLLNQMIKSVHNNHTSDLHQSFKFKIKFSKVWGTRLRQWTDNASSRGGSRRSPYSIFTNVSLWGHIRHLSNLLDWLSFIYISELCWKNYYNLSYRWAFSFLCFKKKPHMLYETLHFHQSIGEVLYVSADTRLSTFHRWSSKRLVDYFDFCSWQLQKNFCIAQVWIKHFVLI